MPSNIMDERIVSMQFDNASFEKNAAVSLNTLNKLNDSLKFTGMSNGFSNVQKSAEQMDFSNINSSLAAIQKSFSFTRLIAIGVLTRIANKAVITGEKIVKAMTLKGAMDGFKEYELKMNSIKTIIASTGESLQTVNRYLKELNEYSDKTIYSFSDMTSNIGKFTNAGVKLKDAVAAIKGVSNVAALSGANAAEASRAMYNFSQALSAGFVKLIDWKSIENANMATVEFKTELLKTAEQVGTVKREADGMYKVLTKNSQGSVYEQRINATHNFNDSLAYQWMTTEALVKTLRKYTDVTTKIGKKATIAATKVRTWSQLMDTTKEAIGSSWAETFEYILGDFNEAAKLFTMLSKRFETIVSITSDDRNKALNFWKSYGGYTSLVSGLNNALKAFINLIRPIRRAITMVFGDFEDVGRILIRVTNEFNWFTQSLVLNDKKQERLYSVIRKVSKVIWRVKEILKPIVELLFTLGKNALRIVAALLPDVVRLINQVTKPLRPTSKIIKSICDILIEFSNIFTNKVIKVIQKHKIDKTFLAPLIKGFVKLSKWIRKGIPSLHEFINVFIGKKGLTFVTKVLNRFIHIINFVFSKLVTLGSKVSKVFTTFFKSINNVVDFVFSKLVKLGSKASKVFTTLSKSIKNVVKGFKSFGKFVTFGIGESLSNISKSLTNVIPSFDKFSKSLSNTNKKLIDTKKITDGLASVFKTISSVINKVVNFIQFVFGKLKEFFVWVYNDLQKENSTIITLINKGIIYYILYLTKHTLNVIERYVNQMSKIANKFFGMFSSIGGTFNAITKYINDTNKRLKAQEFRYNLIAISIAILSFAGAILVLSKIDPKKFGQACTAFAGSVLLLTIVMKAFSSMALALAKTETALIALREVSMTMLMLSVSMLIISNTIHKLALVANDGNLQTATETIISVLIVIFTALVFLANMSYKYNGLKGALSGIATIFMSIAIAINLITSSIMALTLLSKFVGADNLAVATLVIISLIVGVATAVVQLNNIVINPSAFLTILSLSALILSMTACIALMSVLARSDVWNTLTFFGLIALSFISIIAGINAISAAVSIGAVAALLALSVALVSLSGSLLLLSSLGMERLKVGLLALAGTLVIFAVAARLIAPVILIIVALATSFFTFSVGLYVVSNAILILVGAFTMLVTTLALLGKQGPEVLNGFTEALSAIFSEVATLVADTIIATIGKILMLAPKLLKRVFEFIVSLLGTLVDYVPQILQKIVKLIRVIRKNISPVIEQLGKLIIVICEGLLTWLDNNLDRIVKIMFRGISIVLRLACLIIIKLLQTLFHLGEWIGSYFTSDEWSKTVEGMIESAKQVGIDVLRGFAKGLLDLTCIDEIASAVASVGGGVISKFKDIFDSNSPSKVMKGIGNDVNDGLELGIKDNDSLFKAAGKTADGVLGKFNKLSDTEIDSNINVIPNVSFANGVNEKLDFSSIMSGNSSLSVNSAKIDGLDNAVKDIGTKIDGQTDKLEKVIKKQNDIIKGLNERIDNIDLVLDSGKLVGGIANKLDKKLGRKSALAKRGAHG